MRPSVHHLRIWGSAESHKLKTVVLAQNSSPRARWGSKRAQLAPKNPNESKRSKNMLPNIQNIRQNSQQTNTSRK